MTGPLPRLVALSGRKRSGKGTTAQRLVEAHGYVQVKFADPLKAMLSTLYACCGVPPDVVERLIEGDLKEVPLPPQGEGFPPSLALLPFGGKTSRHAMQTLGTEWRELIQSSLWVDIARMSIARHWADGRRVVVDDMRFPHELEAMREMGALLWKVVNPRQPPNADGHASERELPDPEFDALVMNGGTIAELWEDVDGLIVSGA